MKRFLVLFLALALCLSSLVACQSSQNDNETENTESESTDNKQEDTNSQRLPAVRTSNEGFEFALASDNRSYIFVSKGTCADEKITVPATHNEIPVSTIAEAAFTGSS